MGWARTCFSFFNVSWHFIGTVTRSQAWDTLVKQGAIRPRQSIEEQDHRRKIQLVSFSAPSTLWNEEIDMYPDIIKAMDNGLYEGETGIFVVDTHSKGEFHADISVAHQEDDRLPCCLRYFIELKIPKSKLKTAENGGQILDYFNAVHERQPYRLEFVACPTLKTPGSSSQAMTSKTMSLLLNNGPII